MANNSFVIKIDSREVDSGITDILSKEYKITPIKEQLKTGDYIINNEIVIERKTSIDLAQSIIDGRLFRQAAKMKQSFEHSFFIIEGDSLDKLPLDIHPHAVKGALVSIALSWQIPFFHSENINQTALLLWLIGKQQASAQNYLLHRHGRRPHRFHKKQLYILQGLPQVGPVLANQLLEQFGSVESVITASYDDLLTVPGIGENKAKAIKEIVSRKIYKEPFISTS